MTPPDPAVRILDHIADPVLLLDTEGLVIYRNRSADRLVGGDAVGRPLAELLAESQDQLKRKLSLWRRSSAPLPGVLSFLDDQDRTFRVTCQGSRAAAEGADGRVRILVHCTAGPAESMEALKSTLRSLQCEIRTRRSAQAVAEQALRDRELILRELQHRVKNNIQVVLMLVRSAMREATSEEARTILAQTNTRLSAAATVQQLLYQTTQIETVDAREMLNVLVEGLSEWIGDRHRIDVDADPAPLPNRTALPIALIVNELVTNSVKHGRNPQGIAEISITLRKHSSLFTLRIADTGPGFEPQAGRKRASGLGLVRGLVRQLGGSLTVDGRSGACTVMTFSVE